MKQGKVVILGCGMQGQAVVYDLVHRSRAEEIVVTDSDTAMLNALPEYDPGRVSHRVLDAASESDLFEVMSDADVVVEALPATFALPVGELAARAGVHLISSMYYLSPEISDPAMIKETVDRMHRLHLEAEKKKITILPEFGVDPGIDLIVGAQALSELDEVHEFYSYGTGLPVPEAAGNPLKYKFSWSVMGVMKAYTRPGRIISEGEVVVIPGKEMFAPENLHELDVEELGVTLECYPNGNSEYYAGVFNLSGSVREMARYTCRYTGHAAFWYKLVNSGFLDVDPVNVGDVSVSPRAFTADLLNSQDQFHYGDKEEDFVLIRIDVRGIKNGDPKRIVYELIDRRDMKTGFTAMQRTVGFTMGLGARMILEGKVEKRGLISPIDIPFELVNDGLESFGMALTRTETDWTNTKET